MTLMSALCDAAVRLKQYPFVRFIRLDVVGGWVDDGWDATGVGTGGPHGTRRIMSMVQLLRDFQECEDVRLPTRRIVCPRCDGKGTHDHPAFNGFTQSDREDWADDDFMEEYRRGSYDVLCEECEGRNVVDEVDEERCDPAVLKLWAQWCRDGYEYRAECAAERRMGA
jgi:hypothetical protein